LKELKPIIKVYVSVHNQSQKTTLFLSHSDMSWLWDQRKNNQNTGVIIVSYTNSFENRHQKSITPYKRLNSSKTITHIFQSISHLTFVN